ncbi:MAG: hypothetical protein H0X37_02535 [Herpetosiphonaceae bacterium]|nr:hypothetical protein [Herpetosiphonaceae bacterium]
MQVEASLFSGRRNPTWHLSPTQANEFEQRLAQLPVGRPQPTPDGLGYRGLNVHITKQPTNDQSTIFVYKDVIRVTHQGATQTYHDIGQRVEHWLVQSAQEHVPMDIFGILKRVIQ